MRIGRVVPVMGEALRLGIEPIQSPARCTNPDHTGSILDDLTDPVVTQAVRAVRVMPVGGCLPGGRIDTFGFVSDHQNRATLDGVSISLYTYVLGEPTRLEDGDIFVNWSASGVMERVSKDGTSKWQINTNSHVLGFHTIEKSLYR